jgi:hypothetical protein
MGANGHPAFSLQECCWQVGQIVVVAGNNKFWRTFPGTGEHLPFHVASLFVADEGDASNVANYENFYWQKAYVCSDGYLSFGAGDGCTDGHFKSLAVEDGHQNLRHTEDKWVPSPYYMCYSIARAVFVRTD